VEILIKIPEPVPPETMAAVNELLARVGSDATVDTGTEWTVERAEKLLRDLAPRTMLLMRAAIESPAADGWVDGPAFREKYGDGALRGPSQAITKALKRGAEQGHWSPDITPPLKATTPDRAGWSKTGGYYFANNDLQPLFRKALENISRPAGSDT
jgi:hypothetical protein